MTTTIQSNPSILAATIKHWQTADQGIPTTDLSKARYLTPAEITALLLASRTDPKIGHAALLACALLSGISVRDLALARWHDLDLDGHSIDSYVIASGGYERRLLNPPTHALLHRWQFEARAFFDLLFGEDAEQIDLDDVQATLNRIARVAGIPALSFDDLQRSHEYIALGVALCDAS